LCAVYFFAIGENDDGNKLSVSANG